MALAVRRFTVDEYYRMVEAGILREDDRVELLDGQIVEMTPIGPPHRACVNRLTRLFAPLMANNRATVSIQNAVVLGPHHAPEPDVALLQYRADGYLLPHPGPADTSLIVEVADSSVHSDRRRKIPLYAEAGIPEVWLVNLPEDAVEVYRNPAPEGFASVQRLARGTTLRPDRFPDLELATDEVLGPRPTAPP